MQLSFKSPAAVAAGLVVIIVGAGATLWWLFSSTSEVLFDHLDSAQLNGVSSELDRAGIDYRIDRENAAVIVANQDARHARGAVLASGNLAHEAAGFELFDKSDFGMTEFSQRINYQRAIEGEIARTVSALAEIKHTRVHLVLPEHSLFQSEQRKPRASVTVFLSEGAVLPEEHVKGIQRITASAVPELEESEVTVVNQNGAVLSDASGHDGGRATPAGRLLQKKAVEAYLHDKIRQVLTPAVGAGNFAVSVDAILDLNQRTTTTEKVLGGDNNGVKRLKESANRNKNEDGSDDSLREVEYAVGHQSEQIIHGVGDIRRLQVGVVIDSRVKDIDIARLRELIAATAGLDSARGDNIAVVQSRLPAAATVATAAATNAAVPAYPQSVAAVAPLTAPARSQWLLFGLFGGGLAAGGCAVFFATRPRPREVDELALQQLRQRLQTWAEEEALAVDNP